MKALYVVCVVSIMIICLIVAVKDDSGFMFVAALFCPCLMIGLESRQ